MDKIREILVFDTEQANYNTLCGLLNQAGIEQSRISHVASFETALVFDLLAKPDLIFASSDCLDEGFIKAIHQKFPDAAVIILGESDNRELAVSAAKAGVQDFLVKWEFKADELERIIQYTLERKREQIKLSLANFRFELANKATNEIIWDSDLKSGVTYMSNRKEVFGYPLSITREKGWWESHLHPDDAHRVMFNLEKHISSGLEYWSDFYRFKGADGSYRYIHDRGCMMRDENGLPIRMVGTMSDITYETILKQQNEDDIREIHKRDISALLEATEKEKHAAGQFLHDQVLQILAVAKMVGISVQQSTPLKDDRLDKVMELIDESLFLTRKISSALKPISIHEWGLGESIEMLVNDLKGESGTEFVVILPEQVLQKCRKLHKCIFMESRGNT
ncbi:MAG: PAS domain-containing protein [Chitinophagaceae bacterium]|nr:PAS domain-containing protein [Chitinophagaceae bacterium]